MNRKRLEDYQVVCFDLDGTLYYQKPFRLRMMRFLMGHLLVHPTSVRELYVIKTYRQVREYWDKYEDRNMQGTLDERQYQYVAAKYGLSAQCVQDIVSFYMLQAPLKLLPAYRDEMLADMIHSLQKKGIKVVIYSDYPVTDKLASLQLTADACFTSADERIGCMKPDPKGLCVIMETLQVGPQDILMIGDRYEKDGMAAIANHIDYVILPSDKKSREALIDGIKQPV